MTAFLTDRLMQQVNLRTLLESGIGSHVKPGAGQPVDEWPCTSRVSPLQNHVQERGPIARVFWGQAIGKYLADDGERKFPNHRPLFHRGIHHTTNEATQDFCRCTVLVLVTSVFEHCKRLLLDIIEGSDGQTILYHKLEDVEKHHRARHSELVGRRVSWLLFQILKASFEPRAGHHLSH